MENFKQLLSRRDGDGTGTALDKTKSLLGLEVTADEGEETEREVN